MWDLPRGEKGKRKEKEEKKEKKKKKKEKGRKKTRKEKRRAGEKEREGGGGGGGGWCVERNNPLLLSDLLFWPMALSVSHERAESSPKACSVQTRVIRESSSFDCSRSLELYRATADTPPHELLPL